MLSFTPSSRGVLGRYRRGEPISGSRDTLKRAGHLLGIHENLQLLFSWGRMIELAKDRSSAFADLGSDSQQWQVLLRFRSPTRINQQPH